MRSTWSMRASPPRGSSTLPILTSLRMPPKPAKGPRALLSQSSRALRKPPGTSDARNEVSKQPFFLFCFEIQKSLVSFFSAGDQPPSLQKKNRESPHWNEVLVFLPGEVARTMDAIWDSTGYVYTNKFNLQQDFGKQFFYHGNHVALL